MSNLNGFVTTADEVASACDLMGRIFYENGYKMEDAAMRVTYQGFTGELVRLEQTGVEECGRSVHRTYSISIADDEKKVTYSFADVDMRNVTIIGGR